jgi:hypothetical protein
MKKVILIIFLFVLASCASRKVQTNIVETKTDSIVEQKDTVAIKIIDSVSIVKDITIDEITITPVDTCRPFTVDGKVYKNVVIKIKKIKDNSLYSEKKTVSKNASKKQLKRVTKAANSKTKQTIRKSNPFKYFILLFILIVILFLAYKYFNKTSILRFWVKK